MTDETIVTERSRMIEKRLSLFPISIDVQNDQLTLQGYALQELAREYGTPLYLYDAATLAHQYHRYRQALQRYPGRASITYAGKAYLSPGLIRWLAAHGAWVDCSSAGEILATRKFSKRIPILVHGVNKSASDLELALRFAQTIVVDNLSEWQRLIQLHRQGHVLPDLWLRFRPGVPAHTHRHIQTGHETSKFGMSAEEILSAIRLAEQNGMRVQGLHFHIGSQWRETTAVLQAIEETLKLASEIRWVEERWHFCPGGGWGVPYHEDDLPWPVLENYLEEILSLTIHGVQRYGLPLPDLHLEPGRSLIAQAGIAIYQIGTIKRRPGRTWLLVDGGLADNPRPALYNARYTALPLQGLGRAWEEQVWIGGPYCESGDVLIQDLAFPKVEEGEYIAVPVSGAYQISMASNYNGAYRPAVLWIEDGRIEIDQKREKKLWWQ
jgi:diaminopimelate decarboxylase